MLVIFIIINQYDDRSVYKDIWLDSLIIYKLSWSA
jgi:hypothetical protein